MKDWREPDPPWWVQQETNPEGVWGVCSVCREPVRYREIRSHPCPGYHVDSSWNARTNPHNTPWFPGYRWCVGQESGEGTGRKPRPGKMVARRYSVCFEITEDGQVRHIGGIKPSPATQRAAEEAYRRGRPGSNWYPGCEGL